MAQTDTIESPPSRDNAPNGPGKAWTVIAVVLIAVSIFFRFWRLSNIPGLNGDEAEYGANCLSLLHHQPINWYTNDGNFRNPFYYIPLFILQSFLPPSIALLRVTAAIYGVVALWVNWRLCGRVFGASTAAVTTLLLAVLPENIAQSRLGWDPSQSVLIDAIVYYLALMLVAAGERPGRILAGALITLFVAITVHPTNIFMGLFVLAAVVLRWKSELGEWLDPRVPGMKWVIAYVAIAAAFSALLAWKWSLISAGLDSTLHTNSAEVFPLFYLRLFNGITVLRYVAGALLPEAAPQSEIWAITLMTAVFFVPLLIAVVRSLNPRADLTAADRLVFLGWLLIFAAFLVIGGAGALLPGNERFGLVLIVPGVVAVVRSWEWLVGRDAEYAAAAGGGALAVSAILLGMFYLDYFHTIETTGGRSEQTFRTAAVEPKLQAWNEIQSETTDTTDVSIVVTSAWWNYQPLRYFASNDKTIWILETAQTKNPVQEAQVEATAEAGRLWFVEFAGSEKIADIKQQLDSERTPYHEELIDDYAGKPILDVVHVMSGHAPAVL